MSLNFLIGFFVCIFSHIFAHANPKIYDCFLFFNELAVLEIKLNELYDHVDFFVLAESTETFRGDPKPLYFAENKQKFSKFLDKIIHVVISEKFTTDNPWEREFYQRNQLLRGLSSCDDQDIVIIEDLDEIISASKLSEFVRLLVEENIPSVTCSHTLYTYYLNRYGQGPGSEYTHTIGSALCRYAEVKAKSPQEIRFQRYNQLTLAGGWHFTYMGGPEMVRKKLETFSHSELDTEAFKDCERIRKDVEDLKLVDIDESYPQFVREHIDYFISLGLIDVSKS